jgi:hypothetical protein
MYSSFAISAINENNKREDMYYFVYAGAAAAPRAPFFFP